MSPPTFLLIRSRHQAASSLFRHCFTVQLRRANVLHRVSGCLGVTSTVKGLEMAYPPPDSAETSSESSRKAGWRLRRRMHSLPILRTPTSKRVSESSESKT
jgi:hypothetical protein